MIDTIHAELIAEHGGAHSLREGGDQLVGSALDRPRNRLAYVPDADIASLTAALLFGLVKNHGYVDGNKRVGFASAATFLLLNGRLLTASEVEAYDAVIAITQDRLTEDGLTGWLRQHTTG